MPFVPPLLLVFKAGWINDGPRDRMFVFIRRFDYGFERKRLPLAKYRLDSNRFLLLWQRGLRAGSRSSMMELRLHVFFVLLRLLEDDVQF